ncbi:protein translocase subunit SecDF, partial [Flavobacteriaceae bacterium]|nr:protein translocase subunit SecDF [Flavobacteriaceae bacterium]
MQNKGLVKLFAFLFGMVSIYQLSFSFKANQIEDNAKQFAIEKIADTETDYDAKRVLEQSTYLDSLKNEDVYNIGVAQYNFDEVKEKAMNLGLDLKGGISVILQISVKDILVGLANESKDPVFRKALSDAEELQKDSQNTYLEDFFVAFDAIKGDTKLASPDIFANRTLSEEITFNMTDNEVKPVLSVKIDESIVSAFEVLRKRIDKFGVTQPNIQRIGNSGRILVELPGAKDIERVKGLLQSTAQLEFWDAFKGEEFGTFIFQANEVLKELVETTATETDTPESTDDAISDIIGDTDAETGDVAEVNPLIDLIRAPGYNGGPVIASFEQKDKQQVIEYLNNPQVRALLSSEQRYAKFVWGIPQVQTTTGENAQNIELVELYALKGNRDNEPPLSGAVITDARQAYQQNGNPSVSMQMNLKGAKIWEDMTGNAFNTAGQIAIVLDEIVYSAPGVTTGAISGGNSEISGSFTLNEAVDLANVLRAGKLPASADIVQAEEVGPSLGQE